MTDQEWMVTTAAKYVTRVTIVPVGAPGWIEILTPNPRRWRVSFQAANGGNLMDPVIPVSGNQTFTFGSQVPSPLISEFPKEPSVTAGPFWGFGNLGGGWLVIECLFTEE